MDLQQLVEKRDKVDEEITEWGLMMIEVAARSIMKRYPKKIRSFMMGMGTFCFFCHDGSQISEDYEFKRIKGGEELFDLILELDQLVKICGCPVSFTRKSEVKTDW